MKLKFWEQPAKQPVICERCGRDMNSSSGCVAGCGQNLITYGNEPQWAEFNTTPADSCRDCGAALGELHHQSCSYQWCPIHNEQAAFCECNDQEDDTEEVLV